MQRVVFVEVLDRRGRPRSRSRFTSLPISIGRAYTNDVIIDDRYISPEHLRVTVGEDGKLMAVDLQSLNGLFVAGHHDRRSSVIIEPRLKVKIGETVLRFIYAADPVAPAKPMTPRAKGLAHQLNRRAVALAVIVLCIAVLAFDRYLELYQEPDWSDFLGMLVGLFVGFLIWAGIWSFSNRLVSHRFDLLRHLSYLCFMMMLLLILQPTCEYVRFFSTSGRFSVAFSIVAYSSWLMILLAGHLSIIGSLAPMRRRIWAFGVTAALVGIIGLLRYVNQDNFSRNISISTPIKAVGTDWLTTVSMDSFLSESATLKEKVDALVAEEE